MKRNVIVFGLISGLIVTSLMGYSVYECYKNQNFEGNMVLGYASMIIAFSFVFIGIKNYRDKYHNGIISFGKAFRVGLLITLVASTMYVLVWLISYYLFIPDFMDRYVEHVLRQAKTDGVSPSELAVQTADMEKYKEMYKSPFMVILFTYLEIFPVGLIITLLSALILKRKSNTGETALAGS